MPLLKSISEKKAAHEHKLEIFLIFENDFHTPVFGPTVRCIIRDERLQGAIACDGHGGRWDTFLLDKIIHEVKCPGQ